LRWSIFYGQGNDRWDGTAEADPGDKSQNRQRGERSGEGCCQRKGAKQQGADDDDLLPPNPISQVAEQSGTQHVAEETKTKNWSERRLMDSPCLDNGGRGKVRHLHVITFDEHEHTGPERDRSAEPADFLALDQVPNVYLFGLGRFHGSERPHRFGACAQIR